MAFMITLVDNPGVMEKKLQIRPLHIEYVMNHAHLILASGGCFPDDSDIADGALFIVDLATRADAVDYIENDPFFRNGIFSTYTIRRWKKFIFDYKRAQV
ncbi:MAG: YciI family protein [Pseudomonadota bacterium]